MVHRAIYGSFERFMGIIIEHFAGNFPFWLCPTQAGIVPVSENNFEYAKEVAAVLKENGITPELDLSQNGMGAKVNSFRKMKVPYTLILGEQEENEKTISIKIRGGKQQNGIPIQKFVEICKQQNKDKNIELIQEF